MAVVGAGSGVVVDLDVHPRRHFAEVSPLICSAYHTLSRHLQTSGGAMAVRQGRGPGQRRRGNQGKEERQHEESKKSLPLRGVLHHRLTTVLLSTLFW
uniref:Uncharacterized protein n=1 Tax=Arundo donax TaxID=35708 RepID=A0A0A9DCQ9_ARUDO